jgi:hypothetical protein
MKSINIDVLPAICWENVPRVTIVKFDFENTLRIVSIKNIVKLVDDCPDLYNTLYEKLNIGYYELVDLSLDIALKTIFRACIAHHILFNTTEEVW